MGGRSGKSRLFKRSDEPGLRKLEGQEAMQGAREALDRWYEEKGNPKRDEMFDSIFLTWVEQEVIVVVRDEEDATWMGFTPQEGVDAPLS